MSNVLPCERVCANTYFFGWKDNDFHVFTDGKRQTIFHSQIGTEIERLTNTTSQTVVAVIPWLSKEMGVSMAHSVVTGATVILR